MGTYSWFVHLECWRVPAKVWLAFGSSTDAARVRAALHLMDSVSICGFSSMSPEQQDIFIEHVRNQNNWARAPSDLTKSEVKILEVASDAVQVEVNEKKTKPAVRNKAVKNEGNFCDAASDSQAAPVRIKNEDALTDFIAPAVASPDSALTVRASLPQKRGGSFIMPIPGKNGALPGAMNDLTVVLTGL